MEGGIFSELGPQTKHSNAKEDYEGLSSEDEEDGGDGRELEGVWNFLEEMGHTDAARDTSSLISSFVHLSYIVSNSTHPTT